MSQPFEPKDPLVRLQAECDQLRDKIKILEEEGRRNREILTMTQLERDGYLQLLQMLATQGSSEPDWQQLLRANECKTLEEFLPELVKIVG